MFFATKISCSLDVCFKILGIVMLGCLSSAVVSHAVQWPAGKYGLPMANSGCPKANGFSWETGYIYQDLEDDNNLSGTSSSFHLNALVLSSGDVRQSFCIKRNNSKTVDQGRRSTWPAGQYCIYKKGSSCPTLLQEGSVLWDDENGKTGTNLNFQYGTVPGGNYNQDTEIKFCCQTVGSTSSPIALPIDSPFYLMAYNNRRCQKVWKTIHTEEFIRYDTENDLNHNSQASPYPFGADFRDPYIYYCYYRACRWTKTALTGTFWSPNYPLGYKNYAWCEWYINVPWNYIISLSFADFKLELIDICVTQYCRCDYVEVKDNFPNGNSVVIGKYCMGVAYPHGAIKSRSNNVTVTFRSDSTIGKAGFMAQYQAIQVMAPTSLGSTTKETQMTTSKVSTVIAGTFPITDEPITTSGNNGDTSTTSSSKSSSSSSSSSSTTTTVTTPSEKTTTNPPSPATNVSSMPTSEAKTATTKQNETATSPFTNASTTTGSFSTGEQTSTRPHENTKGTQTTRRATEKPIPPTESRSSTGKETSGTTTSKEEGVLGARNKEAGKTLNVYIIVGATASLIVISIVVAGAIFCLYRKRQLRNQVKRGRLSVVFTAREKPARVANYVPNMYGTAPAESEANEKEEEPRYTNITAVEKLNILYDNRAFMDSDEKYVEDDEIKESDNPLYSSSVETEQDENQNILYESMDEISHNLIEEESANPVYDRLD